MATELKTVSGTWTCPPNVYEIIVECWGAGGGEYDIAILSVTPNETYSFIVGVADYVENTNTGDTYWVDTSTVFAQGGWDNLEPGLIKITYEVVEQDFQILAIQNGVEIQRKIGELGEWNILVEISDFTTTSYSDTNNLQNGTTYYLRMRRWEDGVAGDWSNVEEVIYIAPTGSTNLSMNSLTNNRAILNWFESKISLKMKSSTFNRSVLNFITSSTYVEIYRKSGEFGDWIYLGNVESADTYLDEYNFLNGEKYYYRVRKSRAGVLGNWSNIEEIIYTTSVGVINLSLVSSTNNRSSVAASTFIDLSFNSSTNNRVLIKTSGEILFYNLPRKDGFDRKKFDRIYLPPLAENVALRSITNNRSIISLTILENNYMILKTQTLNRTSLAFNIDFEIFLRTHTDIRSVVIISGEESPYVYLLNIYANNTTYSIPIYSLNQTGLNNNSVRIYYNNETYVFDAVPTTHFAASPIRVMTNEGILSLKRTI